MDIYKGTRRTRPSSLYYINGNCSECYQTEDADCSFSFGWARRRHITSVMTLKYLGDRMTIMPFLDNDLLKINCTKTNLLQCIIYKLFFPELLNIPFTNGADDYYHFSTNIIEEADRIISKWKNNLN